MKEGCTRQRRKGKSRASNFTDEISRVYSFLSPLCSIFSTLQYPETRFEYRPVTWSIYHRRIKRRKERRAVNKTFLLEPLDVTHCRLQDTLRPNGTTNSPRVIKSCTTTTVELVLHRGVGHTQVFSSKKTIFFPPPSFCSFYRFGNRLCIVSKFWLSLLVRLLLSTIYYRSSGWPSQLNRTAPSPPPSLPIAEKSRVDTRARYFLAGSEDSRSTTPKE